MINEHIKINDSVKIISGAVEDHIVGDIGKVINIIDNYFYKVEVYGKWAWNYRSYELEKMGEQNENIDIN